MKPELKQQQWYVKKKIELPKINKIDILDQE